MRLREAPEHDPDGILGHTNRLSSVAERDGQTGGCPARPRAVNVQGACRSDVTDAPNSRLAGQPEPARRRKRRRRRRRPADGPVAAPLAGGLLPPVIKVEIQNLDAVGTFAPAGAEDEARLEARRQELEEREVRLASAEAELADRVRRLEDLEAKIGPEAALVESREGLERREQRATELERRLRDRSRELEERENDLDARKAVLEADLELREEDVERREDLVGIREERLAERQRELGLYVSQIQGRIESHLAAG